MAEERWAAGSGQWEVENAAARSEMKKKRRNRSSSLIGANKISAPD
jgi:hypothetical protein